MTINRYWQSLVLALTLQLTFPATASMEHDAMVHNANARATFAMATTAAVYLTVMNHGDSALTLTSVSVADEIAGEAQIHTTVMEGDMMKMRQVTAGIDIEPGAMVEFKPGGYHVMLMGLVNPLEKGNKFSLTLHFADATTKTVEIGVGAEGSQGGHHHH
ncbi:copper chaperone PCu(A)C [uncultured Alteromonas sp.]|jgi:copper(I)-binding protein|uniref:copper chaperone PCu(A)C n=1 Tax=uncultured Alteromonas sp. TaxID=179113 RepID=UPI0025EB3AB2|nr:copper chaperone PCu(A)C [uncultured Alteromonas sp.]